MLRPILQQAYAPLKGGRVGRELRMALLFWKHVLAKNLTQAHSLVAEPQQYELFTDARGQPPHLGAVLIPTGSHCSAWTWTDCCVPDEVIDTFAGRDDDQIVGLETVGVILGLATFARQLHGLNVRVWCDNVAAECILRRGSAKQSDHNMLAHWVWRFAHDCSIGMDIQRVSTHDNVADEPSRECYALLHQIGAERVPPVLPEAVRKPRDV